MKIHGMRRFSKASRLQADSVPEVTGPFEEVSLRLSRGITFDGGKLRPGHVLNALIHVFNGMPEAQRAAIAMEAVARLEVLLAENEQERMRAMDRLPASRAGHPWLPGSVRDQTAIDDKARPQERKRAEGEYGKGGRLGDEPKKGGRKGIG